MIWNMGLNREKMKICQDPVSVSLLEWMLREVSALG